ncbi:MAG: tetratricopeptide repeat protein [Bacteroidia bacterium]|nr:tetratricopeptide repeat protein [Bacteroidia bacterium]
MSDNRIIDSLSLLLNHSKEDSNKVKTLNALAWNLKESNVDTSIVLSTQALLLAKKINWKRGQAQSEHQLGVCSFYKGNYSNSIGHYENALILWQKLIELSDKTLSAEGKKGRAKTIGNMAIIYQARSDYQKAIEYYLKALQMNEELGDKNGIARDLLNIGTVYKDQAEYSRALEYYFRSLKISEESDLKEMEANILGNIGIVYQNEGDQKSAIDYLLKSLKMSEEIGLKKLYANNLANIGNVYRKLRINKKALAYFERALKINEEMNDQVAFSKNLGNLGNIYLEEGNYPEALRYYKKALIIGEKLGDKDAIATDLGNIGLLYTKTGKLNEAEESLLKALAISNEIKAIDLVEGHELCLSELYKAMKKPGLAFEHYKKYVAAKDKINNEENQKKQVQSEMNYEFGKKEAVLKEQQEKERAVAAEKNRFQRIVIASVISCLLLVIGFAFFVFRSLKKTRLQKNIIEEKQREILDSIRYAKRIQNALLTSEKYMERNLNKMKP